MRRRIDLDQIKEASLVHRDAVGAFVTRSFVDVGILAVDRFCQQARRGRFAGAAWPAEEISMTDAPRFERVAQRPRDMFLSHHVLEGHGTPFQVESLFWHVQSS